MYNAQAFLQREWQNPSVLHPLTDSTSMRSRKAHSKVPGAGPELACLCQASVPQERGLSHQPSLSAAHPAGVQGLRAGSELRDKTKNGWGWQEGQPPQYCCPWPSSLHPHMAELMRLYEMLHWQDYAFFNRFLSVFRVFLHFVVNIYMYSFLAIIRFVSQKLNSVLSEFRSISVFQTISTHSETWP